MSLRRTMMLSVTLCLSVVLASGCGECAGESDCAVFTFMKVESSAGQPVHHFRATVDGVTVECDGAAATPPYDDSMETLDCFDGGVVVTWSSIDALLVRVTSLESDESSYQTVAPQLIEPAEDDCGGCPYRDATVTLQP